MAPKIRGGVFIGRPHDGKTASEWEKHVLDINTNPGAIRLRLHTDGPDKNQVRASIHPHVDDELLDEVDVSDTHSFATFPRGNKGRGVGLLTKDSIQRLVEHSNAMDPIIGNQALPNDVIEWAHERAHLPEASLLTYDAHANALAFSADGKLLAVGSHTGVVRVFDLHGELLCLFENRDGFAVICVAFMDATKLLSFTDGGHLMEYDIRARTETHRLLKNDDAAIMYAKVSPARNLLAVQNTDYVLKGLSLNGVKMRRLHTVGHCGNFVLSHDGMMMAMAYERRENNVYKVCLMKDGAFRDFHNTSGLPNNTAMHAYDMNFSPDGALLATTDFDGRIHVWDVARLAWIRTITPPNARDKFQVVAFAQNNALLAAINAKGKLSFWNVASGKAALLQGFQFRRSADDSIFTCIAFSPDGTHFAACHGGQLRLGRVPAMAAVNGGATRSHTHKGRAFPIHTGARGGKYIVVGKQKKKIYL